MTAKNGIGGNARKLLDAIIQYKREHGGCPPSIRKLSDDCGLALATIYHHLGVLENVGLITRRKGSQYIEVAGGRWEHRDPELPEPLKIVLEDERPESWNKLKRMTGWKWQEEVEKAKWLMRAALGSEPPCFDGRVDIEVVAYFDRYPMDSSNVPLKLYEDGLIGLVIPDDSRKHVRWTATRSEIDRDRPRVEITIRPVEEETNDE